MVASLEGAPAEEKLPSKSSVSLSSLINRYQWLVLAAIVSSLGFVPSTLATLSKLGFAHLVHAVFAIGWIVVLSVQLHFLKRGCYRNHRYLGWLSLPVFAGMVVSAAYLLWLTAVAAFEQGAIFRQVYWVDFVLLPASVSFFVLGLVNIRKMPLHAGYMCMTAVVLIPPGLGRLIYVIFLYPLGLPLAWFFELMAVLMLGMAAAIGIAEKWRLPPVRWTFVLLLITFITSYWVESHAWLQNLVREYFYLSATSAH
ncbi:hypothetical protein [Microbulbifer hydrolyticus]|uniref:Uncharacterized protein n=1 Tax=Microbulbifer hydrolyticus TaxID=48074 RepID=A0A6P1TEL7_9GAMM|nr:hypothetical protein [Microbulbifer hydrolyticus]MBB5212685.1 hypothetical protein [Microbulbifer hydrolyticus]QHQ40281.1 hypothetical protein GTQ55_15720 [Microbulbifer hydrolyticus]